MYARAVEDASTRLRELQREEWQEFGLAAFAIGLAVAAAVFHPALAVPLFVGGLAVAALGVRALWSRWDLVDRLAGERDAYVIGEVLAHATRETTAERRQAFAALIRVRLDQPEPGVAMRVRAAAAELEALAGELDDSELALDPARAIACMRLLTDPVASPLLNETLPPDALPSRIRQIRSGFSQLAG